MYKKFMAYFFMCFCMLPLFSGCSKDNLKTVSKNLTNYDITVDFDIDTKVLTAKQTVDRLNELNNDNEELKHECNYLQNRLDDFINIQNENEQLKAQLYCDSEEGVCSICKHHYLEKGNIFYISKCEKGHEKCSTDALKHCKDFEVKELEND